MSKLTEKHIAIRPTIQVLHLFSPIVTVDIEEDFFSLFDRLHKEVLSERFSTAIFRQL